MLSKILCESNRWNLIEDYFNKYGLVKHQLETFDQFLNFGIYEIINNESNITFTSATSEQIKLKFTNVQISRPTIVDDDRNTRVLYPAEARQKSIVYDAPVYVDVDEYTNGVFSKTFYKIQIARVPLMLGSNYCNLKKLSSSEKIKVGENDYDRGGYFIVNGNERVLVGQMRNAYNRPMCYRNKPEDPLICEIRSMSEETAHSISIQLKLNKNGNISLIVPNIKTQINVGYVLNILTDLNKIESLIGYEPELIKYINIIKEYINDDVEVCDSDESEEDEYALVVLNNKKTIKQFIEEDLFPHLGLTSTNEEKAIMLCTMIRRLILVHLNVLVEDDRDNYFHKRIEMAGVLCFELFRMLYKRFLKTCFVQLDRKKRTDLSILTKNNTITTGLLYSFSTGNWGAQKNNYIRNGVSQIPQPKVSFSAFFSYLRRFVVPIGKEGKNTKIRQIHQSSIFFACPSETPEGKGVGVVLNMAIFAGVSLKTATVIMKEMVKSTNTFKCICEKNKNTFIIFINGVVVGYTDLPDEFINEMEEFKQNGICKRDVSFVKDSVVKEVHISSDSGRFVRPLIDLDYIRQMKDNFDVKILKNFEKCLQMGIVKYVDAYQINNSEIAVDIFSLNEKFKFMELHPSGILGVMAAQIPFSDHTQSPRICYQASMAKQGIGCFPAHYIRTENCSRNMNHLQRPLVSTKIAEINHFNELPNGCNAMVAVACYTGFNQEDSIILNKSSVDRGLYHVTVFKTLVIEEKFASTTYDEKICIPEAALRRYDLNYSLLDKDGIVKIKSKVKKNDVVVGKVSKKTSQEEYDSSLIIKTGEEGVVDRIIKTNKKGVLIIKIVIATIKIPEIGDKFCSGMAQKGTCGMILSQEDMPFTKNGEVPDLIINPHCLPSRMTINQIMACVLGKICCSVANEKADATPFQENFNPLNLKNIPESGDDKIKFLCETLEQCGYHYDGTEIMYSGFSGEKLKYRIFFGPTYYHRLTHMVSEKMHARSQGQITTLTRQPVPGRSKNGGLRIGEMEKDNMLVHGLAKFTHEKMFDNSDPFTIKLCKKCKNYFKVVEMSDGVYLCKICDSIDVVDCYIPFSAKLLCQELNAMGIKTDITAIDI